MRLQLLKNPQNTQPKIQMQALILMKNSAVPRSAAPILRTWSQEHSSITFKRRLKLLNAKESMS